MVVGWFLALVGERGKEGGTRWGEKVGRLLRCPRDVALRDFQAASFFFLLRTGNLIRYQKQQALRSRTRGSGEEVRRGCGKPLHTALRAGKSDDKEKPILIT